MNSSSLNTGPLISPFKHTDAYKPPVISNCMEVFHMQKYAFVYNLMAKNGNHLPQVCLSFCSPEHHWEKHN